MLHDDFDADCDEHKPPENFRARLEFHADFVAQFHAQHRQRKRHRADDCNGRRDANTQERERQTHRQRVDARGYRVRQHGFGVQGRLLFFDFVLFNAFENHFRT